MEMSERFIVWALMVLSFLLGWWTCGLWNDPKNYRNIVKKRKRRLHDQQMNILGQFRNAVERAYPGVFTSMITKVATGDQHLYFMKHGDDDLYEVRVTVYLDLSEPQISLEFRKGHGVRYPVAGVKGAIETVVASLSS